MNPPRTLSTETLRGWLSDLSRLTCTDDAERVEGLGLLEQLKGAAAAAQARITVDFAASQRAEQEAAGVSAREAGMGIAAQVALARHDSPFKGSRHLGMAQALAEMPHTATALARGELSEWQATLVVRETACLTREDRGTVDTLLAARSRGLDALGDRGLVQECRRHAYRLDPYSCTRRSSRAVRSREPRWHRTAVTGHPPAPISASTASSSVPDVWRKKRGGPL
jgi:hypothetical protein